MDILLNGPTINKIDQGMKKTVFLSFFMLLSLSMSAQGSKTTEIRRNAYGHIIGNTETTTDSHGNQQTVYKDRYGHITGTSTTRK